MKKLLTVMMVLVLMLSFTACSLNDESKATTTEPSTTESADTLDTSQLLSEIMATDTYLSLADKEYKDILEYIRSKKPDDYNDRASYWNLNNGYILCFDNDTHSLTLEKGDYWRRVLCENLDNPNDHPAGASMEVLEVFTFQKSLNSIKVWNLGEEEFSVKLPSSEIEIVGTYGDYIVGATDNPWETIIRSDSTIGSIINENGEFHYKKIASDCAGPIQKYMGSVWYVNKDAELIHLSVASKKSEIVAKDVTSLVSVHDGTYSIAWREKGSLKWHEPKTYVNESQETKPWSERGGM